MIFEVGSPSISIEMDRRRVFQRIARLIAIGDLQREYGGRELVAFCRAGDGIEVVMLVFQIISIPCVASGVKTFFNPTVFEANGCDVLMRGESEIAYVERCRCIGGYMGRPENPAIVA